MHRQNTTKICKMICGLHFKLLFHSWATLAAASFYKSYSFLVNSTVECTVLRNILLLDMKFKMSY